MSATHTTYYNLNKPDRQDFVSVVTDINDNMDKIDTALHGKASLDGSGKVPASELPSYVDDVIEGYYYNGSFYENEAHTTLITPETDKIYVDLPSNSSYRWGGSVYVRIDNPEDIIDDNAGSGDTDKVWSADKVTEEFASQNEVVTELLESKADIITVTDNTPASVKTFPDGAYNLPMKVVFGVDPVQDLHGQNNPYPPGSGKNLLPMTIENLKAWNTQGTWNGNVFSHRNVTFDVQTDDGDNVTGIKVDGTPNASGTTMFNLASTDAITGTFIFNGCPSGGSTSTYCIRCGKGETQDSSTYLGVDVGSGLNVSLNNEKFHARINVEYGTTMSNKVFYPMFRLSTESDATFAPFSNICPITGFTGAELTRTGKNLFDDTKPISFGRYVNGVWESINTRLTTDYYSITPNINYTVSVDRNNTKDFGIIGFNCFDKNKQYVTGSTAMGLTINNVKNYTFKITDTSIVYIRFTMQSYASSSTNISSRTLNGAEFMFEKGDSLSPYEPFGTVYSITFPVSAGTVYGGELTINKDGSGSLVVDRCQYSLTGNEAFDVVTANGQRRYQSGNVVSVLGLPAASTEAEDITSQISSHMVALNSNNGTFGHFRVVSVMIFNDSESAFADATAFKAYLSGQYSAGTPVQVVYKLATPVTYSLTAEQVKTLLGVNNVWVDTGDVQSIVYPADTKLYIDHQISASQRLMELIVTANHEDEMKAKKAYSTGDLLIVNGTLYKATTSIANGANLTVDTNVTATTVAAELAALA